MMGIQAPIPVSQMMESRSIMRLPHPAAIAGILTLSFGIPSVSAMQAPGGAAAASPYTYADIADLATEAPIVLHARIHRATDLKPERAPGVAAGHVRFYVEADVVSLIRGRGPLAARISYLVDLPVDAKGKAPKLKRKQPVLIFAGPVAGSAAVPARDTLAWYRLACGLPRQLPLNKLAGTPPEDRRKAASDYGVILGALGECTRTRTPPVD